MKKILIFGANGQLGHDVVQQLSAKNFKLLTPSRKELDFLNIKKLSVELDFYFSQMSENDTVINCMAMTNTSLAEDNRDLAYQLNCFSLFEIIKRCQIKGIEIFHISTDYVFDGNKSIPYLESDLPCPANVYGLSKLAGENILRGLYNKFFILRVSSLYGIHSPSGNFVDKLITNASECKKIVLVNDQFMSPTHTLDVAKMILLFIENKNDNYGIYHVVNSGSCSWYEFGKEILNQIENDSKVQSVSSTQFQSNIKRPQYSVLNNQKISKFFKMPSWKKSLSDYINLRKES